MDKGVEGVPVKDFSFCMGCFEQIIDYLTNEIGDRSIAMNLKLRLNFSQNIGRYAKVGVAKIESKSLQFMSKLASYPIRRTIKGILKEVVEGKAKGELSLCNHET
ncbi:MAG: hypothetical protein ACUVTD_07180 [Nitrososphaerales archaeon]